MPVAHADVHGSRTLLKLADAGADPYAAISLGGFRGGAAPCRGGAGGLMAQPCRHGMGPQWAIVERIGDNCVVPAGGSLEDAHAARKPVAFPDEHSATSVG